MIESLKGGAGVCGIRTVVLSFRQRLLIKYVWRSSEHKHAHTVLLSSKPNPFDRASIRGVANPVIYRRGYSRHQAEAAARRRWGNMSQSSGSGHNRETGKGREPT